MKKLLLLSSLFLFLGIYAHAELVREELNSQLFKANSQVAYTACPEYTSTTSGLTYKMGFYRQENKGTNFQQNAKKGSFFNVTKNANGYKIVSVEIVNPSKDIATYFSAKESDTALTLSNQGTKDKNCTITGGTDVKISKNVWTVNNLYFAYAISSKASSFTFDKIIVTYDNGGAEDTRKESGLAFPKAEYTVNLGKEFESPVATAFEGAEIEYSIDNEKVATIDAQTGKVTIVGAGTATVSAISKETEEYKEGVAEYTLYVIDPNKLSVTFDFRSSQSDTEFTENAISAKFEKGSGSTAPQWFGTGTAMRLYAGNTLTLSVPQGYYISSVEFTTDTSNKTFNDGTTVKIAGKSTSLAGLDGLTWTAGEKEVVNAITIQNGGTKGHIRIQTITVNYATAFNPYSEEELTPAYVNADYFDNVPLDKNGKGTIKVNNGELKGVVLYFKHEAAADESETLIRTAEHEGFAEGTHNETEGTHEFDVPSRGTISYYGYHTASATKGIVREVKADLETGVEDVVADNESEVKYFNLNGVQVNGELVPGVYVRIKGDKAEKVLVK